VNRRIVDSGVHGYLATNEQEWVEALTTLARDGGLRARMGVHARHLVETSYSTQVVAPRLARLLVQAAGASPEKVVKECAESQAS
jgi:hypothetical protein